MDVVKEDMKVDGLKEEYAEKIKDLTEADGSMWRPAKELLKVKGGSWLKIIKVIPHI